MEPNARTAPSPERRGQALVLPHDWRLERDAPCPVCRYNLRGLHDPRCPECGSSFRWQEIFHASCARCGESLSGCDADTCPTCKLPLNWPALLDSARVIRRGMYEYTNRPVRAAIRTMFAVLIPPLFWRGFVLEMPPHLDRLRKYRRWAYCVGALGLLLVPSARMIQAALWMSVGPIPERALIVLALGLGMPLLIALALPRFTPTLAHFRVRPEQLRRCLTYLASSAGWLGIVSIGAMVWHVVYWAAWWRRRRPGLPIWHYLGFEPLSGIPTLLDHWIPWTSRQHSFPAMLVNAALIFVMIWSPIFEYVALRSYLRLKPRDALALTVCTHSLALLVIVTGYAVIALVILVLYFD